MILAAFSFLYIGMRVDATGMEISLSEEFKKRLCNLQKEAPNESKKIPNAGVSEEGPSEPNKDLLTKMLSQKEESQKDSFPIPIEIIDKMNCLNPFFTEEMKMHFISENGIT